MGHKLYTALFSEKAAKACGSTIWEDEAGAEVEVTSVCPLNIKHVYEWDDAEARGTVVRYKRLGLRA